GSDKAQATLSVINGEGRSAGGIRNSNDSVDVIGRLEAPLQGKRLKACLSGYFGSLSLRGGPPAGSPAAPVAFVNADKILWGADARWLSPWGTQFRVEYVGGILESTPDRSQFLKGNHVSAWYFTA